MPRFPMDSWETYDFRNRLNFRNNILFYWQGPACLLCLVYFQFCHIANMAIISYADLAKFGYKQNMKEKEFKHPSYTFLATVLEPCIEIWWYFLIFWKFGQLFSFFFPKNDWISYPLKKKFTKFTRVQNSALQQKSRNALKK